MVLWSVEERMVDCAMSSSKKSGDGDERRRGFGDDGEVPNLLVLSGRGASLRDFREAELRRRWDETGMDLVPIESECFRKEL